MSAVVARLRGLPSVQVTLALALLVLGFLIAAQVAAEGPRIRYSTEERSPLIETSLELSVASHGAFDITYASVGYLYDFRPASVPARSRSRPPCPGSTIGTSCSTRHSTLCTTRSPACASTWVASRRDIRSTAVSRSCRHAV